MSLIFENKVPASYRTAFVAKVRNISNLLGINPNWLMAIMYWESARTFSPSITNSLGYTGLIQFGATAAADLGTTTAQLRQMTAIQQLDYVYAYYKLWYKRLGIQKADSYISTYLITLFPAAVNKPLNHVIQKGSITAERFANNNPAFDLNKDKKVTVQEVETVMLRQLPSEWIKDFVKKKD
ncbi:MAG: hypothetical protein ACK4IZ_03220 [Flavobacterium sp.]|uniref:hypothetical protein n=1 Tax=Flavobacterium sp. TaxID=239 RepID=UPI00391D7C8F